jgi:hypothetical protein
MSSLGMHGLGLDYANRVDRDDNAMDVDMPKFDLAHDGDYEKNMNNMFQKAYTPLFQGYPTSCLAVVLLLLDLVTMHEVSNAFVDELFHY